MIESHLVSPVQILNHQKPRTSGHSRGGDQARRPSPACRGCGPHCPSHHRAYAARSIAAHSGGRSGTPAAHQQALSLSASPAAASISSLACSPIRPSRLRTSERIASGGSLFEVEHQPALTGRSSPRPSCLRTAQSGGFCRFRPPRGCRWHRRVSCPGTGPALLRAAAVRGAVNKDSTLRTGRLAKGARRHALTGFARPLMASSPTSQQSTRSASARWTESEMRICARWPPLSVRREARFTDVTGYRVFKVARAASAARHNLAAGNADVTPIGRPSSAVAWARGARFREEAARRIAPGRCHEPPADPRRPPSRNRRCACRQFLPRVGDACIGKVEGKASERAWTSSASSSSASFV